MMIKGVAIAKNSQSGVFSGEKVVTFMPRNEDAKDKGM
jgi:hypothetical protein